MIARLRRATAARAARRAADQELLDACAAADLPRVRLRTNTPVFDQTVYETGTKPRPVSRPPLVDLMAELDILAGPISTGTLVERGQRVTR